MSLIAVFAWICFGLAALPLVLVAWNLTVLRPLRAGTSERKVSILIPARNESANIGTAIESVLGGDHDAIECLVLDDDSTDDTAAIVSAWSTRDPRVRLVSGVCHDPALWGKPQACAALGAYAKGDYLVFMDADVRLAPDAISRIAAALDRSPAAMLSGVPHQETQSFAERLVVPLIQFVLLGFLPIAAMRASPRPGFGVACGQILAVRRDAYLEVGGHGAVADRIHDGLALARRMRESGHMTDLADFSDLATCRMYRTAGALIAGFAKNAHEGLGSPRGIVPWTVLLIGGQVAWIGLLPAAAGTTVMLPAVSTAVLAYLTRVLLDLRFRQATLGTALHPVGMLALVAIQWYAAARRAFGMPVAWKSRVAQSESRRRQAAPPNRRQSTGAKPGTGRIVRP
jgi:Glycosyl transferase family 2